MISLISDFENELNETRNVKSSFDFATKEGKIVAMRLAASYGLSLSGLINDLMRKAIEASIEDVPDINDEDRLDARRFLDKHFPEKRNVAARNFLRRIDAKRNNIEYILPESNMTSIYNKIKLKEGLIPVGNWKITDDRPHLNALYKDERGNIFDSDFRVWNPAIGRFINGESLPTALIRKAFNEGWVAKDRNSVIYDLSPAFGDWREKHFPTENVDSREVEDNFEEMPMLS